MECRALARICTDVGNVELLDRYDRGLQIRMLGNALTDDVENVAFVLRYSVSTKACLLATNSPKRAVRERISTIDACLVAIFLPFVYERPGKSSANTRSHFAASWRDSATCMVGFGRILLVFGLL